MLASNGNKMTVISLKRRFKDFIFIIRIKKHVLSRKKNYLKSLKTISFVVVWIILNHSFLLG